MRRVGGTLAAAGALLAVATTAHGASLYDGPGPRPGPDLLYEAPTNAPQLRNRPPWRARPILVSGTTAYRNGEFLYQDYLYDDNGARQVVDPGDRRTPGNLFSKQNGTYTYPSDPKYANNAADLVELRVKPGRRVTAFRLTLNTLKDPSTTAFTIAIGGRNGQARDFPFGANVRGPADLFLTVHPSGNKLVGELSRAASGRKPPGGAPKVVLNSARRQVEIRVSKKSWNPRTKTVRLAAGVGLWDEAAGTYLLPQAAADATHPGGAGTANEPAAFFNVAFRTAEPIARPDEGTAVITDPAWWRDREQGSALAAGDITPFHANVSFRKLARRKRDESKVPTTGPMDRILASRFELSQGADFSQSCLQQAATCPGQYQGRLQPYAIYIPKKPRPAAGYGLTLLMHSLSANYNQYLGTRNQSQYGERGRGSIVITPEARGPDENYENYGAADVFEVWADVARRYRLDPDLTVTSGYSMGGFGSFKLGSQFPDLFARMHPTVAAELEPDVLASLRNVPVLMWNNAGDELANDAAFNATAAKLDSLGYRYEIDEFRPCAHPQCSPLFPNHLQLAVNDQYQPGADFLGEIEVDRNPPHVTYVVEDGRNHPELGVVGDHAYWVSGLARRDAGGGPGEIDARSRGFGVGDPPVSATVPGTGVLDGGNLGPLEFASRKKTWGERTIDAARERHRRARHEHRAGDDRRAACVRRLRRGRERGDRRTDRHRARRLRPHGARGCVRASSRLALAQGFGRHARAEHVLRTVPDLHTRNLSAAAVRDHRHGVRAGRGNEAVAAIGRRGRPARCVGDLDERVGRHPAPRHERHVIRRAACRAERLAVARQRQAVVRRLEVVVGLADALVDRQLEPAQLASVARVELGQAVELGELRVHAALVAAEDERADPVRELEAALDLAACTRRRPSGGRRRAGTRGARAAPGCSRCCRCRPGGRHGTGGCRAATGRSGTSRRSGARACRSPRRGSSVIADT